MTTTRNAVIAGALMALGLAALPQAQRPTPPVTPAPAAAPAEPRVASLKAALDADVSSAAMYDLGQQMNDMVFSFGEIGFQEFETQKYLGGLLRENGFTVQDGVAGIPTAWVARWGSGRPVIAFGSDIDGIPQGNQKPGVAYHDPMVEGAPGHGEGHNSGTPLNIVAALAVKRIMEREKLPGTLMIWPGVAEELLGTKAHYVRAGLFKDVDVLLYNHVGANLGTSWGDGGGSGLVSVEYTVRGRDRAQRRGAVARPLGARRGGADERGLELPARAPAALAAHALRHHQRRRPAQRRAEERQRLVLLPRDRQRVDPAGCGTSATRWRRARRS